MQSGKDFNQLIGLSWHNFIRKLIALLVGDFLVAVAIVLILRPNQMISGGVSGITVILNHLTHINMGLILFLLNAPLLILGFIFLKRSFMVVTMISAVVLSIYTGILDGIMPSTWSVTHDTILACIFGGVLNGMGMGICFRNGCSTGGFDIVGAILKSKYNITVGNALMVINTFVIGTSAFIYSVDRALYTLVALFISYQVVDRIHLGVGQQKQLFIISAKHEEIVATVYSQMRRGMTYIKGEGAYSHANFNIIYMICTPRQVVTVKSIVAHIDPNAFMAVSNTAEIQGRGFEAIEI
ncbi:YitT family protein [Peptoniphilus equinus]|uniref:YitT family protein n=1 Tax=Peptoniphilus equinus TaxID=3016343 RepID=A0ABY7QTR3_9FIRM|nr:YitT family protein [Peptoniphilus equinus]WBW50181.1 YitT family protein [Peptoniphilus equinus]